MHSAPEGFYFQASNGSVALPVAGYDYNSVWTPLLAGLSPAGMAASLAAPDPYGPHSGTRLPPRVFDGEALLGPRMKNDLPRPFIIGYGSSPSRCGPERRTAAGQTWDLPVPVQGASAHARFFDHAGPFGPCDGASETCCLPRSKQRRHPGIGFIAVGMVIADHPPHRSEHALLTHSAPTSSM